MTSFAFFVLLVILTFLTLFSRLGYLSLVRASAVVSDSMEPSIRRFDLVVYTNTNYIVGDVIVYCVTLSHRVVHRIVGFLSLDTVGGNMVMIVIKGDNVNETDSPVDVRVVKGRVVLIVPRELWIPLAFILVIYSLLGLVRSSVVGISYAIVVAIMLASIAAVYATVSQPLAMAPAKVLTMNLAGVYLDPNTYNVSIRYTGELSITSVSVRVNSTLVSNVSASEREVVFKPYLDLLGGAFEQRVPVHVEVIATLNHVGRLSGEYTLLVGGQNPEVSSINGILMVRSPNCLPVRVNVSTSYLSDGL